MNEKSKCPLCGDEINHGIDYLQKMSLSGKVFGKLPSFVSNFIPFQHYKARFIHGKKMIHTFKGRHWIHCDSCIFSSVYPKITPEALNNYYSADYWSIRATTDLEGIVFAKSNTDRAKHHLKFLNDNGLKKVETMLDFGAGMCGASAVFKPQGFCRDITIFDKASQAREIANMLGIQHIKNMEDKGNKKFDLIYSSHSLEHVQDIGETLTQFSIMVKKEGHVFIEVPNVANKTVLEMCHHAPHTYNFSQKSLCKAMLSYGFETIACETYGPLVSDRIKRKFSELNVQDSIISLFKKRFE